MKRMVIAFLLVLSLLIPCHGAEYQELARDGRISAELPDGWTAEEKKNVKRITENAMYDH